MPEDDLMCNDYSMSIAWKPGLAVLALSYLTLLVLPPVIITLVAQTAEPRESPKSLPPTEPRQFRNYDNTLEGRLASIERSNMKMEERQAIIFEQMKMVLEVRKQVFVDAETLHNVADALRRHEDKALDNPGEIAELRTKVNWLLLGLGGLVTGSISWMFKQARSNDSIAKALHNYHQLLAERHKQVDDKLDAIACLQGTNGISKSTDIEDI